MAKQKESPPAAPGKMTIMLIQLEGNDATLQEGIRTFKEAMGRAMPATVSRPQLSQSAVAALAAPTVESNGAAQVETDGEIEDAFVVESAESNGAASTKPANRKPPVMNFVKDLNLHPKDKTSLKDFVAEKKPANQLERITVCVYYLCRILELTGVTSHHVYTCLKDIGAKTPNDLPQTMRTIAKRKGYIDASNGDDLKITNPGDNFVEHTLPRA